MQTQRIPFPTFLQQLAATHENCVVMLHEATSGNADLYQKMVARICQELNPSPAFLTYDLNHAPFELPNPITRGSPVVYYCRDGMLKSVIEGIVPYHHFLNRIQLFNNSIFKTDF